MRGTATGPGPAPHPEWVERLRRLHREGFTGCLTVEGPPDARVHLRGGLLVAVRTPAAPGPGTLLVRSGAVSERAWAAAHERGEADGAADGGEVGAVLLELALVRSVLDGVFSLALRPGARSAADEPGAPAPPYALAEGISPGLAWAEAQRRIAFLTARWAPPAELMALRPTATAPADTAPSPAHARLMAGADGRRTPRDLAFLSGREVSGVLADVMWLVDRGLLEIAAEPREGLSRRRPEPAAPASPEAPLAKRLPGADSVRRAPRADAVLSPEAAARLRGRLAGGAGAARGGEGGPT